MKLFFKHIRRSIRMHPLQPVLIIFAVTLAVCVGVVAVRFCDVFKERGEYIEAQEVAMGEITIGLSTNSKDRLLFQKDVEALVGDRAEVYGDFAFAGFYGTGDEQKIVTVRAADLEAADRYFDFKYEEYGRFTDENFERSAVVSAVFANTHGLHTGDEIEVYVLNESLTYTIQAVARHDTYFSSCEVLVAISGVMDLLAERSPVIASLAEDFVPCNTIKLRARDKADVDSLYKLISESEEFCDDNVQNHVATNVKNLKLLVEGAVVTLLALLLTALCSMLIITSLSFLSVQRELQYSQFSAAGASPRHIAAMKLGEGLIYALLGGGLGVVLAIPALEGTASLFSWYDGGAYVGVSGAVFGILFAVVIMLGCTLVSVKGDKKKELAYRASGEGYAPANPQKGRVALLIILGIFAALTVAVVALPVKYKYIPAIAAVAVFIATIYLLSERVVRALSALCERLMRRLKRPSATLLLAIKNTKNNFALRHMGRLLTVTLSLLLVVGFCGVTVKEQYVMLETAVGGEIIALNIPDNILEELEEDDSVRGVAKFEIYTTSKINGEYIAVTVAASENSEVCMSDKVVPDVMPRGRGAVISKGLSLLLDADVGDCIRMELDGIKYEFDVVYVQDTSINIIYVDVDAISSIRDMYNIKLEDGVDPKELIAEMESQGVIVMGRDSVIGVGTFDTLSGFLSLVYMSTIVAVVISMVGLANMLLEQIQMRRKERELLRLSGMTQSRVRRMSVIEVAVALTFAALLAIIFASIMCLIINAGVNSFGCVLI